MVARSATGRGISALVASIVAVVASIVAAVTVCSLTVHAQPAMLLATKAFTANNINAIVSPSSSEIVSVIFGLEGGLLTGETQNPALGEFASDVITSSGSNAFPKDRLRDFLSRTSTTIYGEADARGLRYRMTTPLAHFDEAWRVLASIVLNPEFDSVEFRNIMQQRITDARRRWSQPEGYAAAIADSVLKRGHPVLGRITTEADIASVTIPKMIEHVARLTERTRMLVVVVGNVTPEQMRTRLAVFDELPRGSYKQVVVDPLAVPSASTVEIVDQSKSPTTYVNAMFVGPHASSDDYWPMVVGMQHLRARLFEEVRTKRNLSYAPSSYVTSALGQGVGVALVSSVFPDSAVPVILAEFDRIRRGDVDEEALEDSKQVYITSFYMQRLTSQDKALAIFNAERNTGQWERAFGLDLIEGVHKADVVRVFNKYTRAFQFGVVGPAANITRARYVYDPKP